MSTLPKQGYQMKEITQWDWNDVNQWLTENNCSTLISKLEQQNITGYDLFFLNIDQMKAFNILSFHEMNRLNRLIHSKVLEYLRISFTNESKCYSFQLDFDPNLTVENMSHTFAASLGIKEPIFIATQDNKVLFPYIKIIELILIEPDRYRNLKLFNGKETFQPQLQQSSFHTMSSPNQTQPMQMHMNLNQNTGNSATPTNTMPLGPSPLSMKYKSNFDDYRTEKHEVSTIPSQPQTTIKPKDKIGFDDKDLMLNNNNHLTNKGDYSFPNRLDNDTKPLSYKQFKMNQKQGDTIEDQQPSLTNLFPKKSFTNPIGIGSANSNNPQDMSNIKDNKESIDLNNPTTNYIFNSGELMTFEQMKKATGKGGIPTSNISANTTITQQQPFSSLLPNSYQKDDLVSYTKKNTSYRANPPLMNTPSAIENIQSNKEKDDYRRFSSEKRNYRTYGSGLNNNNPSPSDDYQPKAYEKYNVNSNTINNINNNNNTTGDDITERFNSEKFNRFSSRPQPQNQAQNQPQTMTPKQNEKNHIPQYTGHQNNNNIRNQFESYGMERKGLQQMQIPMQTTSSDNDMQDEDSNNQDR